jgi:ATP-dependent DNA helicase RecG
MPEAKDSTAPIRLGSRVEALHGVGKRRARLFARLDIHTVSDLLRHLPMRYEHQAGEDTINRLIEGTIGTARGMVKTVQWVGPNMAGHSGGGGRKGRFVVTLIDDTGTLNLTWFNAGYLREKLHPGMNLRVQGKVKFFNNYPQMVNPKWENLKDETDAPAKDERLRPVYPATEDLSSIIIEKTIAEALPQVLPDLSDPLPKDLIEHHAMPSLAQAFEWAHRPDTQDDAGAARRRLAFNELLLLQLGIAMKRAYVHQKLAAPKLKFTDAIDRHIRARFPFELTEQQSNAIKEIAHDLQQPIPMNRLLQGDVGAGKTVVALYALLLAVADRMQAVMLAPTELLAEQHHTSIGRMLEGSGVTTALLTSAHPPKAGGERKQLLTDIADGKIDIVVGTHALLSDHVKFHSLAVAVIDEQHRFGVMQRAAFRDANRHTKVAPDGKRHVPHHLVMTATPIPRTLSLTLFGDLDISTIRGLPPGRTPITNRVVFPSQSDEVYSYLRTRLERGEQAYVVVPAIDAVGNESAQQLTNVRDHAKLLQDKFCKGFKVATVHGRLKRESREKIMDKFRRGEVHVLVATTVIEVGVDVPNATVMIIEHAERFGLAQLHQLRGRVGRGDHGRRSLCVFISDPTTEEAGKRLEAIAATNDGFKIAERDLQIRGMGDFFGTRQSGLPPLRVATIPEDMELLQLAQRDAQAIIEDDPFLKNEEHKSLRRVLMQQYGESMGLIDVG